MRRQILLLLVITVVLGITAVATRTSPPVVAAPEIPYAINAAADSCESATLIPSLPWGDHTGSINTFQESSTDPVLGCAWGTPSRPQGYRTVWYKFVAPYSAEVTIDTFYSTYDTVVAVYAGSCGSENLVGLACNDDYQGFTSHTSVYVRKGETYYIEVADWQFDVYGSDLSIAVLIDPIDSRWELQGNMPLPRSRHVVVADGKYLYVVGGETSMGVTPELTNSLQRLNTENGNWTTLDAMPGTGYANTSAAVVNSKIFMPSGFTGAGYNGTHYAYDIANQIWLTKATAPWPGGAPLAWGTAVPVQFPGGASGYLYIGGTADQPPIEAGVSDAAVPSNEVFYYRDMFNGQPVENWQPLSEDFPPNLTTARFAHTAAWVQDRVCVVGGLGMNEDGQNILLTNGECYRYLIGWAPISDLNVPRYNAGSAVGPDGRWYVFGGVDGEGNPVEITEYYDIDTDTWYELGASYSLGGSQTNPAHAWPRGTFMGDELWSMGGNDGGAYGTVLPQVEKLFLPVPSLFFPIVFNEKMATPNDTLGTARHLSLNQAQYHTFDNTNDFFDTYYFDLTSNRGVTIRLSDIPYNNGDPSNYDLALYGANKLLLDVSQNPSNLDETITRNLTAGRYYVVVKRIYSGWPPDNTSYRIIVETP
ncbi:MAG: pre-peptidase C-terminal domain-containing protein [Ardenticatenaceae bacterium]|nr:pre-peptidase C-terminal domain-containing protein [Anaerolineales bacterium]MCB8922871.1 pre-peptidase C-terminal domain-containing protein [Ardenticatenaceae bacterium]